MKVNRKIGIPMLDRRQMTREKSRGLGPVEARQRLEGFEEVGGESEELLL